MLKDHYTEIIIRPQRDGGYVVQANGIASYHTPNSLRKSHAVTELKEVMALIEAWHAADLPTKEF